MVRGEEGVDMIGGCGGCDGGDWEGKCLGESGGWTGLYERCVRGVVKR